jgi:glycosyltransferase involved in cell wall biosynthesis
MNVVWLASWFPNRTNPTTGDFIERHALAVAPFVKLLSIIAVIKDDSMPRNKIEIQQKQIGNLHIYIAYYGPGGWGGFAEKLVSLIKYRSLQEQLFNQIKKSAGIPDLVHVHVAMKAGMFARILKKKYGVPYLVTEHWSGYYKVSKPNIYEMGERYVSLNNKVLKDASLLLPVTNDLGETINRDFVKLPYRVIPNVVDNNLFFYKPFLPPVFRFIHPSYMNYPKNPEGILQACRQLKNLGYQFELEMIGNMESPLLNLADDLGLLNETVFFEKEIPYAEVAWRMQQSSVLLLFSRYENLPCIVLEALCCGLPVISSRVGGLAEVINDSNGLLVEKENIAELVKAMQQMMDGYQHYNRPAIAAAASALYNYDVVGNSIVDAYSGIIKK